MHNTIDTKNFHLCIAGTNVESVNETDCTGDYGPSNFRHDCMNVDEGAYASVPTMT
jgi:hypothetical protein